MSHSYKHTHTQQGFIPLTRVELDTLSQLLSKTLNTQYPPVIIAGEAIIGIEAMAAGIASPGRTVLNIVTGPYGGLFGAWLERGGATVVEVKVPFDEVVSVHTVAEAIERVKPSVLSFVHAEVVTGGANPAKALLELAQQYNLITVMDSVSAIGGEDLLVDQWQADFVAVGAQKALAGPNGVSAVSISPRGWELLESNQHAPRQSILSLLDYKPYLPGGDLEGHVPAHIPTLEARALIQALTAVQEEGLEAVIIRHEQAAAATIAGIEALGLVPWQRDITAHSKLTTTVRIDGRDSLLLENPIGIVAPGDGDLNGKLLRINHFGIHASLASVEQAIRTLAELLLQSPDQALKAAHQAWEEHHVD